MLTQIINAKILTPQGWLKDGSVLMRDNKILEVTNCDLAVIQQARTDSDNRHIRFALNDQFDPHPAPCRFTQGV